MPKTSPSKVFFSGALAQPSADKRIAILERIGHSGSISQAAREAGVSYKAAWQAIDTLTNLAGVMLVERVVGGAGGGGARLTDAGVQLLDAAGQLERARQQVLARLQAGGAAAQAVPSLTPLSVRTSMRNQLPCQVQSLDMDGSIVRVRLGWGAESSLVSRITIESAELLSLHPGLSVLALCKATAVAVGRVAAQKPASNQLPGRAVRVSRGASGDEVSLTLETGLKLVGFAPPASGIRIGSRVIALVDESAVVVALPG